MIDVRALLQETLDNALEEVAMRAFWQRRVEVAGEADEQYVVYTVAADTAEAHADGMPSMRSANCVVRHYYRAGLMETAAGREQIRAADGKILAALLSAGFGVASGPFDAGDIDDIGFGTSVFECYFGRLARHGS